jgi:ABC-2 type transport system permease protein
MVRGMLASVQLFQKSAPPDGAGAGPQGGMSMPFTMNEQAVTSGKIKVAGYNGYAHSFAGMGVQFILFMGINMGIEVLMARRSGFWSRLLAAPVTLRTVLLARAASGAIISFGILCAIFLVAMLVFKVNIANPLGFAGVAACFALLTASFGLFIAAFGKTPEAARGLAVFATLIMVMLGGAWVPSFLFPEWVQTVALAMPTRWAIDGFDAMTWRGLGMEAAWLSMGAQLAFTALFGLLAAWKFGQDQDAQ